MHPLWIQLAPLSQDQIQLLDHYLDLLLEANRRMNLTGIAERAAAEIGHVADSLKLLPLLPTSGHRIADVGSGGGIPGMILAIARPDASVTLIESTKKKAAFLQSAAEALALKNVAVMAARAEEVARTPARQTFDVVTARAIGELQLLAEWCLPLVRKGGWLLAMKGPKVREELPRAGGIIHDLGGGKPEIIEAALPGAESHLIVKIEKVGGTPSRFPRKR